MDNRIQIQKKKIPRETRSVIISWIFKYVRIAGRSIGRVVNVDRTACYVENCFHYNIFETNQWCWALLPRHLILKLNYQKQMSNPIVSLKIYIPLKAYIDERTLCLVQLNPPTKERIQLGWRTGGEGEGVRILTVARIGKISWNCCTKSLFLASDDLQSNINVQWKAAWKIEDEHGILFLSTSWDSEDGKSEHILYITVFVSWSGEEGVYFVPSHQTGDPAWRHGRLVEIHDGLFSWWHWKAVNANIWAKNSSELFSCNSCVIPDLNPLWKFAQRFSSHWISWSLRDDKHYVTKEWIDSTFNSGKSTCRRSWVGLLVALSGWSNLYILFINR